jgi:hypothetical protein
VNRQTSCAGEPRQPNIKDYAIIGDCRTAALISREGSLDWLCLPNFSSPSAFARLLDPRAGHFSIRPRGPFVVERRYVPETAVLETTFRTDGGVARLTDLCPISDSVGSLLPMREVLRIVEGIGGVVDLEAEFAPRLNYGRVRAPIRRLTDTVWRCDDTSQLLLLNSNVELVDNGPTLRAMLRITAGGISASLPSSATSAQSLRSARRPMAAATALSFGGATGAPPAIFRGASGTSFCAARSRSSS